jgi:hypothetical protein
MAIPIETVCVRGKIDQSVPAPIPGEADDARILEQRLEDWREAYRPASPEEEWLYQVMITQTVRIDRSRKREVSLRSYLARRAELCWELDRTAAAETAAERLARSPASVARKLRKTKQGCQWLLERWFALADLARDGQAWTDAQKSLADDLRGIRIEARDQAAYASPEAALAIAAREVETLQCLLAPGLEALDYVEKEAAIAGDPVVPAPEINRLIRQENQYFRIFHWARNQLKGRDLAAAADSGPAPVSPYFARPPHVRPLPVPAASWEAPCLATVEPVDSEALEPAPPPEGPTSPGQDPETQRLKTLTVAEIYAEIEAARLARQAVPGSAAEPPQAQESAADSAPRWPSAVPILPPPPPPPQNGRTSLLAGALVPDPRQFNRQTRRRLKLGRFAR